MDLTNFVCPGVFVGKKVHQSVFGSQLPNKMAEGPANFLKWPKSLSILVANLSKIYLWRPDYNNKDFFWPFLILKRSNIDYFLHLVTVLGAFDSQKPEIVASACSGCPNTEDF